MRLRLLGVVCVAGAALTALGAPAANACNEPRLDQGSGLSPGSLGPGDTGTLTVADTDQGAQYTLTLGDGQPLASGVDQTREPGFTAQFTMPDLGPEPRTVAVRLEVTHEGGRWPSEATLRYVPPAPVQPAPAEPSQPAGGPAPPPAAIGEVSSPGEPSPPQKPPARRKRHADEPAGGERRVEPRRAVPITHPPRERRHSHAVSPQPVETSRAATSPVVPAVDYAERNRSARTVRHAVAREPLIRTHRRMIDARPSAIAPTVRRPVPDRGAKPRRDTGLPLALLGGVGALALALLVLFRRRRQGRDAIPTPAAPAVPPSHSAAQAAASNSLTDGLALEAELQELVAEQRARAMLSHSDEHVQCAAETPRNAA